MLRTYFRLKKPSENADFPTQKSSLFLSKLIKLSIGLFLVISLGGIAFAAPVIIPALNGMKKMPGNEIGAGQPSQAVLGTATQKLIGKISFNIPAFFNDTVGFKKDITVDGKSTFNNDIIAQGHNLDLGTGTITASNILSGVIAGIGIGVTNGQSPTITNSGVLSVQGQTGAVKFVQGTGITFNGLTINNAGVTSVDGQSGSVALTPGNGISVDGLSITNKDPGSAQKIFGIIAVGSTNITAGTNADTLTFTAGNGVAITPDATNKSLMFSSTGGLSGLTTNGVLYAEGSTTATSLTPGTSGFVLQSNGSNNPPSWVAISSSPSFTNITSGINTTAAMTVGNGASLSFSGSGTINASSLNGNTFAAPGPIGSTTADTGSFTNVTASGTTTFNGQTYTWPNGAGSNGYVLQTNGSGMLTWVAASGVGTNYWILNTNTISPGNGASNVAIGQTTALASSGLDVEVNSLGNAVVVVNQKGNGPILTASSSGTTKFSIGNDGTLTDAAYGVGILHSNGSGGISSAAVNLANSDVTGTLPLTNGGTGVITTPTNGQILIGNGSGYILATITQGSNIIVSNGSGTISVATSATPTFTSVNGLTITNNGTNTLTIAAGKTLTVNNTLTLSGTDATSFTFPSANDTLVGRASTDTLTNKTIAAAANTITGITNSNLSGSAGITNANLANSSITVTAGTGLSGGGSVPLGSSITINNAGVTSVTGTTNQVTVSASTGSVTLSLPQAINSGASPTFTNVTLSGLSTGIGHFNASGILSSSAIGLGSSDVTGIVGVANGGTGLSSLTAGSIIYGNGTSTFNTLAIGGTNSCLISNGSTPTWSACSGVGTNYFQRNAGVLSPVTITDTLAVGTITPLANSGLDIEQNALGNAAFVDNQTGNGDILTASASGTTRLTLTNTGNLNLATGAYQINGTNVIDASRDFVNIAGIATSLNPTVANTDNLGTSTGNQYNTMYGKTIFQNGNTVCDTSGNCIGGTGGTIGGSGITNYIAKFSDSSHIASSLLYDTGTQLGLGSTTPDAFFAIKGGNYGGNAAVIVNQNGAATNDILSASSSGITKFTIGNDGTLTDIKYGTGIAHINSSGVFSSAAITLNSADVTNTLPVGNGGTGTTTFTTNGILYGNGTSALQVTAQGASGTVLHGNGVSAPSFSAISLTADVSGILPLANGGTNANLSADNGGILYSGSSSLAILAHNLNSGLALVSGGSASPSWFAPTQGSIIFAGANGALSQNNASFFIDNTNNRLGIGGNTNLAATLDVKTTSGTLPVASISGKTSFASLLVDNSGVGPLFSASSSGVSQFTIANNGNITDAAYGAGIAHFNSSGVLSSSAVALNTADITNTLGVSNGGTGLTSLVAGSLMYGNGSSTFTTLGIGSNNTCLVSNGSAPIWSACSGVGTNYFQRNNGVLSPATITDQLAIGQTTALANSAIDAEVNGLGNAIAVFNQKGSGDIFTASTSGITKFTIDNAGDITNAGNETLSGTTGIVASGNGAGETFSGTGAHTIAASSGTLQFGAATLTGTITGNAQNITGVNNLTANGAITFGGLNSTGVVHTNSSGVLSTGAVSLTTDITGILPLTNGGTGQNWSSIAEGNIPYFSATGTMATLAPGTANQLLITNGSSANPSWSNIASLLTAGTDISLSGTTNTTINNTSTLASVTGRGASTSTNVTFNGNVILGQTNTNTITPNGLFNASLIPSSTAINLGSASNNFGTLYAQNIIVPSTNGVAGYWQLNNGALSPANITNDLLVGATSTKSANFAFINNETINGLTAPIASFSGNISLQTPTGTNGVAHMNFLNGTNLALYSSINGGDAGLASNPFLYIQTNGSKGYVGINTGSQLPSSALAVGYDHDAGTTPNFIAANDWSSQFGFASYRGNWASTSKWGIGGATQNNDNVLQIGNTQQGSNLWYNSQSLKLVVGGGIGIGTSFTATSNGTTPTNPSLTPVNMLDVGGGVAIGSYAGVNTAPTNGLVVSGNVGIGNSSPLASLDVRANSGTLPIASISGKTSFAALTVDNSGNGDIVTASSSGLNRFVITQAGNVGVGTTTPSDLLDVVKNSSSDLNATFQNKGSGAAYVLTTSNGGYSGLVIQGVSSGNQQWNVGMNGTANFAIHDSTNNTTPFTVSASAPNNSLYVSGTGNVGINNANPLAALDINGSASESGNLTFRGGGAQKINLLNNSTLGFYNSVGGDAGLGTTPTLFVGSSGNVGIGTTSPNASLQIGTLNKASAAPAWLSLAEVSTNAGGNPLIVGNWNNINGWGIGPATNSTTDNTIRIGTTNGSTWNATQNASLLIGGTIGNSALQNSGLDIETNGKGNSVLVANNSGGQGDIFTASSSGTPKFTINNNGNLIATGAISGLSGINSSGTITFSGLNSTGIVHTNTSGVLSTSAVSLTGDITGILPLANGGTNANLSAVQGGILYSGSSALSISAAGSSGNCLLSGGTGAPTWGNCTIGGGTNYWSLSGSTISPTNGASNVAIGVTTGLANSGLDIEVNSLGNSAFVVNNTGGSGDIFTASSAGTPKFKIDTNGVLSVVGNQTIDITTLTGGNSLSIQPAAVAGSTGGNMNIKGGTAITTGGNVAISGGTGTNGASGVGGNVTIDPGIGNGSGNGSVNIATVNSGNVFIGVTNGLSSITLGQSTNSNNINIGNANTGAGNTQTINIGAGNINAFGTTALTIGNAISNTHLALLAGTGNITLGNATGNGTVVVQPNAGGQAALIINKQGNNDIFTASVSGATKFLLDHNGNITASNYSTGIAHFSSVGLLSSSAIGLNTTDVINTLGVGNGGTGIASLASGSLLYGSGGTGAFTALSITGTNGDCLTSNGSVPSWGSCGAGTNYWQLNSGIITPATLTNSLSIGVPTNTTSLATVDLRSLNGTEPTASISGKTSFAALTVDNSGVGDIFTASSSGLNRFVIAQNGNVGIGTTAPGNLLQVAGNIGIQNSQTLTGVTNFVQMSNGISVGGSTTYNITGAGVANLLSGSNVTNNGASYFQVGSTAGSGSFGRMYADIVRNGDFALTDGNANTYLYTYAGSALSGIPIGSTGIGTNVTSPHAVLDVEGGNTGGNAALIANQTGASANDIFAASASGATKFVLSNTGNITASNYSTGIAHFSSVGLISSAAIGLTSSDITGTLGVGNGGSGLASIANGSLLVGAGGTTAMSALSVGGNGQCLTSNGSTPIWGSCSASGNFWQLTSGALAPANSTNDLVIGGNATSSATFQVFGSIDNAGSGATPFNVPAGTASTSGQITFGTAGGNSPQVNILNGNSLSFVTSPGGDTGEGATPVLKIGHTGLVLIDASSTTGPFDLAVGGDIGPSIDVGANLGNASFRFTNTYTKQLYVGSGLTGGSVPATVGIFSNANTKGNGLLILNQVGSVGDIIDASSSGTLAFQVTNSGNIAVNGGSITTTQSTANIFNSVPTTLNIGGAATTISLGASSGTTTINNTLALAGLSTGSIPFITTGNQITQDNSNLFWDATNKRLGIGNNSSLLGTLDLRSTSGTLAIATISGKTSFAALTVDNSGVGDIFTASSSGLNRFVITQNGNVGIGKTLPSATLDILGSNGTSGDAPLVLNGLGGTGAASSIGVAGAGGSFALTGGVGGQGTSINGDGGTGGSITLQGGTGGNATTLLDGSGGNISLIGGNGAAFSGGGGNGGNIYIAGGAQGSGVVGNVILARTSGGTNQGNVGIGVSNPQSLLSVAGTVEFGSGDNGTPLAESLRGAAASGSNIAGAAITFDASNGTGTGGSGNVQFRTAATNSIVTLDAKSNDIAASTTTMSWSHTTGTQTNKILIVGVQIGAASVTVAANGVTYGGTALTKITTKVGTCNGVTNQCDTELWYLLNPTSGTHTIQVTTTGGTATDLIADAATFYNVDQTTPLGTSATRAANTASPHTLSVTSTASQLVVSAIADTDYMGPTQPQFSLDGQAGSLIFGGMSYVQGSASSTTMSWTTNVTGQFAIVGVPLNPVSSTSMADSLNPLLNLSANGNVGIGNIASPQRTVDVNGSWGGNVITDSEFSQATQTINVDGQGLVYQLSDNSGTQTGSVITFNLTGLPNVDGTFAYVYLNPQKQVSGGVGTNCLNVTVNGSSSLISNICTLSQTGSDSSKFEYVEVIRINGTWRGLVSNQTNAADLAEWIPATGTIPTPGEIVSTGENTTVSISTNAYDKKVAGIVSTNPNTIYGKQTSSSVALALSGRIPAIVTSLNGAIQSGDTIASSPLPGIGMRPTQAAQTVGKALESFSPTPQSCTTVAAYDAITWPSDDGTNPAKPCFAVHVASFPAATQQILMQEYGLVQTDSVYIGKIMVLADLSYSQGTSNIETLLTAQPDLLANAATDTGAAQTLQLMSNSSNLFSGSSSTSLFGDTVFAGTIIADKIKANQIEGLDIFTNQIGALSGSLATINNQLATSSASMNTDAITIAQLSSTMSDMQTSIASLSSQMTKLNTIDDLSQRVAALEKLLPTISASDTETLNTDNATVSGQLSVLGKTLLSDVGITGKVSMGLLTIDGMGGDIASPAAEINTLSGPLKLQSLALNGIDFLNGKILIDTLGNMKVNAEVSARKYNVDITDNKAASLGEATLSAGKTSVDVETTAVTDNSRIFVTSETVIAQPLTVITKTAGKSFTVEIDTAQQKDVKFNWWIVN